MLRNGYILFIFLLPAIVAGTFLSCFAGDITVTGCTKLLQAKCLQCHPETRICQKLEKKSKRAWKRTVKRMVKKGAELDTEQQKMLVQCLSKPSPEVVQYCQQ